jgi:hypothetical protein
MTTWKLVPVEPTEEMLNVATDDDTCGLHARKVWQTMLNAAPAPDVQPVAWLHVGGVYGEEPEEWELEAEQGLCDELNDNHINKPTALPLYTHPPAADVQELERSERYQIQMAAISTASLGYWQEGDEISPEYDTVALRDTANLYDRYKAERADALELVEALKLLMPLVVTDAFGCNGDKCRQAWCWSCNSEEYAESAANSNRVALDSVKKVLAKWDKK